MLVPPLFKRDFELMAKDYSLDETEYGEFKEIVRLMLAENFEFTIKWVHDCALGLYNPLEKTGVVPIKCETGRTDE